jgi:bla regulator protein blaR1
MEGMIVYLLKSAGVLCIFFFGYYFFLRRETSFYFNRFFLLLGIFTSILVPFLYFTKKIVIHSSMVGGELVSELSEIPLQVENNTNWFQIIGAAYGVVTAIFLIRFLYQIGRIVHFLISRKWHSSEGFKIIKSASSFGPCSFFNYIIFDPAGYSEDEQKLILNHEKVHSRQNHSFDILLSHLFVCFYWFNPLSWFYKKSILQNLEYIADKEINANADSTEAYQKTLLKITLNQDSPSLTIPFYKSFLRKRIEMLNKNLEEPKFPWKVGIIIPCVFLYMIVFNIRTEAMTTPVPAKEYDVEKYTGSLKFEQELVELNFTSSTTKSQLEDYQEAFKKRNVDLNFDQVQYSSQNLLQSLRVTYSHTGLPPREYNSTFTDGGEILAFKIAASFSPEGNLNTMFFITEKVAGQSDKGRSKNAEIGDGLTIKDLPENNNWN